MESISPLPGAVVTADSVFRVSVRYQVPRFRPSEWYALPMFAATTAGRTVSGPADRAASMLPDSAGVLQRTVAFGAVWNRAEFARPFRVFVYLTQEGRDGFSHPVVVLGPFAYNVAPSGH